jgi:hypothetical protein
MSADIEVYSEQKHKPKPTFQWNGPLNNYYRDGCCYYTRYYIVATCKISGDESDKIYGCGDNSKKRALANLTENCSCGSGWHDDD